MLYANRRLDEMLGGPPGDPSAEAFEQRLVASDPKAAQILDTLRGRETVRNFVATEVHDQTTGAWFLFQAGPVPWTNGRPVSLRVVTNISAQKHAELAKRQHEEAAHHAGRLVALAEVASTLTHEINQPLAAIASYNNACLRLLSAGKADAAEIVTAMERCRDQAVRAGHIVNRMRDFVRRRRPTLALWDMNAVVRESLELTQSELEGAHAVVELRLATSLPPLLVDRILLVQVVTNLIRKTRSMRCPAAYLNVGR